VLFVPPVWFVILALFLLLYVILDGFDLGVGILSLTSPGESQRTVLMTSLGNVWDANETWLVLMGGALFGAFPLAYGTILKALYGPIYLMILGLILRAVAFEFRENAVNKRPWNLMFGIGSLTAAGAQGICLGTVLAGLPTGELQRLHVRTARLAAATTLGGALLITLTSPFVSESLRARLFDPSFLPFFVVLPVLGSP